MPFLYPTNSRPPPYILASFPGLCTIFDYMDVCIKKLGSWTWEQGYSHPTSKPAGLMTGFAELLVVTGDGKWS